MKLIPFVLRALAATGLALTVPAYLISAYDSRREVSAAHEEYQAAREELQRTERSLEEVEEKLLRLSTDLDAVEDEIRKQLRMIHPGEELILIEYETPQP